MIKKLILLCGLVVTTNIFAEVTTMILPVSVGGLVNRYALLLEPVLSKSLDSPIVLDFKPGAQGLVGARALADIKSEKLVLMMGPAQSVDSWAEFKSQKMVNIMTDITPVAFLGTTPGIIVTNSNKFTNFKEMVEYSKTKPVSYGVTSTSANAMLFRNLAKKYTSSENMQEVPYKSTTAVSVDALSGVLDFGVIGTYGMVSQFIDNKKLAPLAVFSTNRSRFLPNVPTLQEMGLGTSNEFKYYNNMFLWANKNADPGEIKKLKKHLKEFFKSKESENIYEEMDLQFGGKNVDTPEMYLKVFLEND
jgi:tripartite-type tricarboxylate transporter receptor subunit TctC